jgi:immunoglobulin-like protein involved in spore germination
MSDERRDDEIIGRALSRAIETIDVNQTPYERSRIAAAPVRRPIFGVWQIATAAAAIVLALAIGSWLTRPTDGQPGVAASPAAPSSPISTVAPTPSTAIATSVPTWVYFPRDGLPPVGAFLPGSVPTTAPQGAHIAERLLTLRSRVSGQVPAGASNPMSLIAFNATSGGGPTPMQIGWQGDLATVEFDVVPGWGIRGAAQSQALLQQLVYTITEEPGIRRALITEKGKPNAVIDQLVIDKPLSREDVFGYTDAAGPDKIEDGGMGTLGEIADWRASVDQVAPGLGRFVVEFKPQPGAPANATPKFVAQLERPASEKRAEDGKWVLRITLPDGLWNQPPGEAFHCCPLKMVGKTPIIEVAAYPLTADPPTNGIYRGVGFAIVLDDARPWRAMVLQNPTRLVVDVGGTPRSVSDRIAIYRAEPVSATPVCSTTCDIQLSGAARVFEANVVWRVKDSAGKVIANGHFLASLGSSAVWGTFDTDVQVPARFTGNVTLEVYEASPKDGSEQGLVQIPLVIR